MDIIVFLISLLIGVLIGVLQRVFMKKVKVSKDFSASTSNIGLNDRIVRFLMGVLALIIGIYLNSFIILAIAGYAFYEAFAKWCGFYALIGKNTCNIE